MEKKSAFPTIPSDRSDDLYNLEYTDACDLCLFMAGNQFMVMKSLLAEFKIAHPEINRIYCETLPPGLELKQILAGGAKFGDRLIKAYPDIYTSVSKKAMKTLEKYGHIHKGDYQPYLHNRLVLMTPENNPASIQTLADLGKSQVRISQPDPENEDIAFYILQMYEKAGGKKLVRRIMEEKRAQATTIFTIVHHRETPLRLEKGTVDVGPVWATEAIQAKLEKRNFHVIEPGEEFDQREKINYYVCKTKRSPHPENAEKFLNFITASTAGSIYEQYGFIPHLRH